MDYSAKVFMTAVFNTQDTIRPKFVIRINTDKLIPDSVFRKLDEVPAFIKNAELGKAKKKILISRESIITDTTSVCTRNAIADVTLYDSEGFSRIFKQELSLPLPIKGSDKKVIVKNEPRLYIIKDLKEGKVLPDKTFHHDWITAAIIVAAYLWVIVRSNTRSTIAEIFRFILFRGINESSSRDLGALFTWQSTILNFISFFGIGLFLYLAAVWYDLVPGGIQTFWFMLILFSGVVISITTRHFICLSAGNLSGETEVFNEYLISIYKSYKFSSIFLFAFTVILVYTGFTSPQACFITGFIIMTIFYLIRVLRLLLIFIKRNISILYLILYLCALEILPALILVKYFTSLNL